MPTRAPTSRSKSASPKATEKRHPTEYAVLIFADGACSGNPGPGGWGAVIVTQDGYVTEHGGGASQTTNNRMELQAAIEALQDVSRLPGRVGVYTDSVYLINGITRWIWGWRTRGWKTAEGGDVANAEQWKELSAVLAKRGRENPVDWHYVRGHTGVAGNERVDEIAVAFRDKRRPHLYRGTLLNYTVPIYDIPEDTSVPERKSSFNGPEKKAAFSYLSLVGGKLERHSTWAECERRVKGRAGARFKKSLSQEDEAAIIRSWGFQPADLG